MKIMRRISLSIALIMASLFSLSAQDADYKSMTLTFAELKEVHATIPTQITIAASDSDAIEVSYPADAEGYIDIFVDKKDSALIIKREKSTIKSRRDLAVSEKRPIRVSIPSSSIRRILNTSDMVLHIENSQFDNWVMIANTGTMGITGEAIEAKTKIEYYNTGTMTNQLKRHDTSMLMLSNTGFLLTQGETTATHIEQNSTGIENTDLKVSCQKLQVHSTGNGKIRYYGRADSVNVASTGNATIHTSELNAE